MVAMSLVRAMAGQAPLADDDRVDEVDGDVLGIRAPSAVAERDQLAASTEPGGHGGAGATHRIGTLHQRQASFATAGKGIGYGAGYDWSGLPSADTFPFMDRKEGAIFRSAHA